MFKLRFWWVVLKGVFRRNDAIKGRLPFWVTPFECDINLHCNNASYLKYMDLGRWDLLIRMGVAGPLIRGGYGAAAVRVEINFKRALPPIAFFHLETEFDGIGEKSIRLRQKFFWKGHVVAEGLVTVVATHGGRAVSTERLLELVSPQFDFSKIQKI